MIECSICLTSNIISTEKCTLNCHHSFCKPCLDGWFNTGKVSCPICIQQINYFENNNNNYRIVKINNNINNTNDNNNYVMIYKKTCLVLRIIALIVICGILFQSYIIHYLYDKKNQVEDNYSEENEKLINFINKNCVNNSI